MTGRQRNDDDIAAARTDLPCADDGVRRIIAALHDDVGAEQLNQLERRILLEERDGIYRLQRGEDVGPFTLGADGPIGALQAFHGRVTIHPDDQDVPARARADQHVDVARMQQIEYAIREHDAAGLSFTPCGEYGPRHYLPARIAATQYVHSACGEKRISRTMSGSSTRS